MFKKRVSLLPQEAQDLLLKIRSNFAFTHPKDGSIYQNREHLLPDKDVGYYREYTVPTPNINTRGSRRLIIGNMSKHITQLLPPKNDALVKQKGSKIFYLDGREICDKPSFLRKIATVMQFPDYFGQNWDALDECITDLDWFSAERYVLIYAQPDVFAKAAPQEWEIAYEILQSAVTYWQATDTPMDILFIED